MLSMFFDHKITIQRPTNSHDSSGGQTVTWNDVSELQNLDCAVYDGAQMNPLGPAIARRDWLGQYMIVFDARYDIRPGDRAYNVTDGIYYDITGTLDHSNAGVSGETVFLVYGNLRRVSDSTE